MTLKSVLKVAATAKIQINLWSDKKLSEAKLIESREYNYGSTDSEYLMNCISWAQKHGKAQVRFISPRFDGYLVIDIYE